MAGIIELSNSEIVRRLEALANAVERLETKICRAMSDVERLDKDISRIVSLGATLEAVGRVHGLELSKLNDAVFGMMPQRDV